MHFQRLNVERNLAYVRAMNMVEIKTFGDANQLRYVPAPWQDLGEGQYRIAIHSIGVNRADILLRKGVYHSKVLPAVPGFEASGVVTESRGKLAVGTRVLIFDRGQGLYRESAVVPENGVIALPDGITLEEAAALPVNWLSAYYSLLHLLRIEPGKTLLITAAASGVGLAAIQLAKQRGAFVLAAASSARKLEVARQLGADACIEYAQSAPADLVEQIRNLTDGRGVDYALDIIGGDYFRPAIQSLAPFGKMVSLANVTTADSVINTRDFYPKNAAIFGFQLGSLLASGRWDPRPALSEIADSVARGQGRPVIHRTFPLIRSAEAHLELENRGVIGKLILRAHKGEVST